MTPERGENGPPAQAPGTAASLEGREGGNRMAPGRGQQQGDPTSHGGQAPTNHSQATHPRDPTPRSLMMWVIVSQKDFEALTPVPMSGTSFGNRVFAENQVEMRQLFSGPQSTRTVSLPNGDVWTQVSQIGKTT